MKFKPFLTLPEKVNEPMNPLAIVVLAAGKGTRMKSDLVKVLHPIAGTPMLSFTLDLARSFHPQQLVVVVGFQRELVRQKFPDPDIHFVDQIEQLGTGHAVSTASVLLKDFRGTVLILCADVPLLSAETLSNFLKTHQKEKATLSVLTTNLPNPRGYGRVFRNADGLLLRIVEDKDLRPGEETKQEINTGIYAVEAGFLVPALASLNDRNAQKEYYLTDIVAIGSKAGKKTLAYVAENSTEVMGINTRLDLAAVTKIFRQRIAERHMLAGVTLIDPGSTFIDQEVQIGRDTTLHPNTYLLGKTSLGTNCVVEPGCKLTATRAGNHVTIKAFSVIAESTIEDRVDVGPFAHLRPGTVLHEGSRIGNFVEVKKSEIGKGTKASHLTYIGDATIGEKVNIGAGTITCNYDGQKKHPTIIEDETFVGSNTALVAPVKIGRGALIGAGSTITKEVPPETLAVSRAKQVHYPKKNRPKE